jgi:hypothetical protein
MPRGGRRPGAGLDRAPAQPGFAPVKAMASVGERALGVLVEAMQDPKAPWSCRIQAASILCDRAYDRSPQSVGLAVTQQISRMTLSELRQLEARLASEERLTLDIVPEADAPQRSGT